MPGRKPSRMPPECSQAKPSREPGASNSRGSTGPISIVPDCPRGRWRLISRARCKKNLCRCTNIVGAFRESVRSSNREAQDPPEPSQRKQRRRKKNEYGYQKGNGGSVGDHGRDLSRGHGQL